MNWRNLTVSYRAAFVQDDQFMHVTLTMKGLSALGSVPSSLEKQATLFSKIKGVVSKGIKQASAEQVSDLAAQVFSYGLAAAPAVIGKLLP